MRVGLGLLEAIISLAISAMLLTAVAGAFRAASDAIDANDNFFHATQGGRVAMARMLTQVRRGTPATDTTSTSLHLLTDTGQDITYVYDSSSKQLNLVNNGSATSYTLAHNVSQCTFTKTIGTDSTGVTCVAKVTIVLAVTVGPDQVLLSGSASPRRSLTF